MAISEKENVGIVKEETDQTTRLNHFPSDFQQNDESYYSSGSLIAANFILMSILQKKELLSNDESHIAITKKYKLCPFTLPIFLR